jgi:hypothetical protein
MLWLSPLPSVSSTGNTQKARERETTCSRKKTKTNDEIEDGDEDPGTPCCMRKSRVTAVAARKKGRSYQGVKLYLMLTRQRQVKVYKWYYSTFGA